MLPNSSALHASATIGEGDSRRSSTVRRHWLCRELVEHSFVALGASQLSPSVVDLERELSFWRGHYQRTAAWHRDVLPFNEYVPAFTLGIGLFLQCHDCLLEALNERMMALRYARVRRRSRVEWHEARQAVHAAYLRLQTHWESLSSRQAQADATPDLPPASPHQRAHATLLPPRAKRPRVRPA
ncbi:hypothetical protein P6166_16370 [Stenotrophomonas sp. HITSZ_GD]|uniref:hypothetical protein n=1 Tax=Stenotrophomonas sp. HITSZ_GD TaxID=3037248 RepID=UPI00240E5940|nr:hypothetical protein [Stenotrophomonas sp. HITSZ_GD]MDG2526930.1 hypothetical protein [Stenotrophomonas sp. HITSZ_GD]